MHPRHLLDLAEKCLSDGSAGDKTAFAELVTALKAGLAEGGVPQGEMAAALRAVVQPTLDYTSAQSLVRILRLLRARAPAGERSLRLAVLGGVTTAQLSELIDLHLFGARLDAEIYEASYGVFRQEILDRSSALFDFEPTFIYMAVTWRDLGRLPAVEEDPDRVRRLVEEEADEWSGLWERAHQGLGCQIIQDNFAPPPWRLLDNYELSRPSSVAAFVESVNQALRERAPRYVDNHDVEHLASNAGLWAWADDRFFHHAKLPCAPEFLVDYAHSVASIIGAQLGRAKKCLVLDLDNTLWGGVVGDEGLDGIRLGQGDAVSEAFAAFQRYLRGLRGRGVLLAVNSANDEQVAREAFERHPGMVLRPEDVSCFVANWNNKASNLRAIARELDIGLDSMVFVDDDPAQRALVRRLLPEVAVPEMPADPSEFVHTLDRQRYFQVVALSSEDLRRTDLYRANVERRRSLETAGDLEGFLAGLEMQARVEPIGPANAERSAQLLNRTNQFNLTVRRHPVGDVLASAASPDRIALAVWLTDRFGDHGLISVLLARLEGDVLEIDAWVMSCRVLRRGVEQFLMNQLHDLARERGVRAIRGTYVAGPKNAMVAEHYASLGFSKLAGSGAGTRWELSVEDGWKPLETFVRGAEVIHG